MKITIDTQNKTVSIDDGVNIQEFINEFSEMRSDWQEFKIVRSQQTRPANPYPTPYVEIPCITDGTSDYSPLDQQGVITLGRQHGVDNS